MKLSKQEQIISIILIVAAIVGVGIFVFIKPGFDKINVNNKNLLATQQEYANLQLKLEHEKTIDDEIKAAYEDGKNLANSFYDDLTTYEADEIMRAFLKKGKDITIDGLSVSNFSTETLGITVFKETEISYPLKDFANTVVDTGDEETVDIKAMEDRELVMYAKKVQAAALAASEPVTVGTVSVSFNASSDKLENLHNFVDLLNAGVYDEEIKDENGDPQRKATYLHSVSFEMPQSKNAQQNAAEGEDDSAAKEEDYKMSFTVNFYCIKPVADPFANAETAPAE